MQGNRFFCSFSLLILLAFFRHGRAHGGGGFVTINGSGFVMNGRPFYSNGFNAYWLMYMASEPAGRSKVSSAFQQASSHGMTVVRTWAFSDGGHKALQRSPGSYDENMFKGLDFVISEARKYGVYLILSLVNNHEDFGGKRQYVRWARDEGRSTGSDDDFFQNDVVKSFYKNHVKVHAALFVIAQPVWLGPGPHLKRPQNSRIPSRTRKRRERRLQAGVFFLSDSDED